MVHSFFGPSTHTTIWFFMQEYMSVLVVTNHHAGLISWPVGPTERWTLKLSCKSEHTRGRREGKARPVGPRPSMHGGCCVCSQGVPVPSPTSPLEKRIHASRPGFTKAFSSLGQQLPQSSRLMQSWALIVFLTSICITVWLYPTCKEARVALMHFQLMVFTFCSILCFWLFVVSTC